MRKGLCERLKGVLRNKPEKNAQYFICTSSIIVDSQSLFNSMLSLISLCHHNAVFIQKYSVGDVTKASEMAGADIFSANVACYLKAQKDRFD